MQDKVRNLLGLQFIIALSLIPLIPSEVFAQEESMAATETTATSSATSTELTTSAPRTVEETPWFTTDKLSGNLNQGDFVVGPGRTEISLAPGETVIQYISISNRISDDRIFRLEVEDVSGTADGSEAIFLVEDEIGPYSVRDYISFPNDSFPLELGERARIPVTVTAPPDAEPGGYYGSVLVSTVQDDGQVSGQAARQPIVARIGSLFFITVEGETLIEGNTVGIDTLSDKLWYEEGPIDFGILFENTGSVHVNPLAEVSVTNMLGEEVGFVEIEPWFVLPNSLRTREFSWDREFLFGRYTVTAEVNRGYEDIVDTVSVSFWVLPWRIVGGTFLVIFIVLFGIRAFFNKFEFKKKE